MQHGKHRNLLPREWRDREGRRRRDSRLNIDGRDGRGAMGIFLGDSSLWRVGSTQRLRKRFHCFVSAYGFTTSFLVDRSCTGTSRNYLLNFGEIATRHFSMPAMFQEVLYNSTISGTRNECGLMRCMLQNENGWRPRDGLFVFESAFGKRK